MPKYHLRNVPVRAYIIFVRRDFIYLYFLFLPSLVPKSCDIHTDRHTHTHTRDTIAFIWSKSSILRVKGIFLNFPQPPAMKLLPNKASNTSKCFAAWCHWRMMSCMQNLLFFIEIICCLSPLQTFVFFHWKLLEHQQPMQMQSRCVEDHHHWKATIKR